MSEPAAERRRQFRAWARSSHPDAGGDPQEFITGLARWRPPPPGSVPAAVAVFRRGRLWGARRWWQRHRPGRITRVR